MLPPTNPEVLANDWVPPVAIGREREVRDVVRRLDPPTPHAPPPWIVGIAGAAGTGTSTVARRAAREAIDVLRSAGAPPGAHALFVRTAFLRGAHGVATALLRQFDEGFDGRGFPTAEILAGVLRRLRRDGRPTVVVLDDVGVGGADLGPVLAAFGGPDRFLPEGESGIPPVWTLLAGTPEGLATAVAAVEPRYPVRPWVELSPYSDGALRAIVRDRAERALRRPPPGPLVDEIVARSISDGLGARRAVDLLRRALLGVRGAGRSGPDRPDRAFRLAVESTVVRAIGAAALGSSASLGEVRRFEAEIARRQGNRPLPTTTLWRRLVRLERAGYVRREIRAGGSGGTRSVLRLLTPIDEWITVGRPSGTPRAYGGFAGSPGRAEPGSMPRVRPAGGPIGD
jgi:hypothetical protein